MLAESLDSQSALQDLLQFGDAGISANKLDRRQIGLSYRIVSYRRPVQTKQVVSMQACKLEWNGEETSQWIMSTYDRDVRLTESLLDRSVRALEQVGTKRLELTASDGVEEVIRWREVLDRQMHLRVGAQDLLDTLGLLSQTSVDARCIERGAELLLGRLTDMQCKLGIEITTAYI